MVSHPLTGKGLVTLLKRLKENPENAQFTETNQKNKTERVEKRQSWSCLGDQPAAQSLAGLMAADRNPHTPPKPGKGQRLLDSGQ